MLLLWQILVHKSNDDVKSCVKVKCGYSTNLWCRNDGGSSLDCFGQLETFFFCCVSGWTPRVSFRPTPPPPTPPSCTTSSPTLISGRNRICGRLFLCVAPLLLLLLARHVWSAETRRSSPSAALSLMALRWRWRRWGKPWRSERAVRIWSKWSLTFIALIRNHTFMFWVINEMKVWLRRCSLTSDLLKVSRLSRSDVKINLKMSRDLWGVWTPYFTQY